ncbi:tetratricopeptide repeat protein [Shewanella violacea]|uniref:TPR domain protein n=1 Tax=Shewanella violacea (strain JCM 10179 / CIP 106290 / LMG 19151 / DSS12) TaxID=637905 RepID=D4ZJY4_SHEVD|nr:tetratricopeptide repeat protein [Shewanella violacea]BAJ01983.1 TPR domain protein [Shewanella violacea DSS12]
MAGSFRYSLMVGNAPYSVLVLVFMLLLPACMTSKSPEEILALEASVPQRQDLYDAKAMITVATANPPKDEADALARASREESLGNLDSALYLYVQALDFKSDNADTLYQIARIHSIKGNIQLAYLTYNEALMLDADMMMSHAGLGLINMDKRQHRQARIHLEKAVSLDQARLKPLIQSTGVDSFYALDEVSPVRIYNALAILDDLDNEHDSARLLYKLALQKEPHSALIITNLGYSHYLTGNYTSAENYLRQAIREDPNFDRGWTNLGLVYVRKGLYTRALATFEHTMEPADALNDLGYFLMLEGQYKQAIVLFKRAIDNSPSYFEQAQKNLKRASMELNSRH